MALSARTKIAIVVAGLAGAAGLAAGGTALADPGDRTELVISNYAETGDAAGATGATGTTGAKTGGHDCPERDGGRGSTGTGGQAADSR